MNTNRILRILVLSVPLFGCSSEPASSLKTTTTERVAASSPDSVLQPEQTLSSWLDRAMIEYIAKSTSTLLVDARRRGQDLSWIIDRTEPTDSANFIVVQIGHDETESDGSNSRFATAAWVYLDSSRKRIYEYDLPNDSLIRWK